MATRVARYELQAKGVLAEFPRPSLEAQDVPPDRSTHCVTALMAATPPYCEFFATALVRPLRELSRA